MQTIWDKDIMYLKGVGPVRAEALRSECGISRYRDLLEYYPRKYVDRSRVAKIHELTGEEEQVSLLGKITQMDTVQSKKGGRRRLMATFSDGSGFVELIWFQGVKWVEKQLKVGEEIALFGKPVRYGSKLQFAHPEIDRIKQEQGTRNTLKIVPFYPSNEKLGRVGLDARGFRGIMYQLLQETYSYIQETLNSGIAEKYKLISHKEAMQAIHFPRDFKQLSAARTRLKFEEFFFFQLMLARRRKVSRTENRAIPFEKIGPFFNRFFEEYLPFDLTGAQKRVLKEIRRDLGKPVQMNRLIQGDVGSGKTMVAFMSMLMAKDNGFQCAMMAPTAILAEQHFKKLSKYGGNLGLKVDIIVGAQKKAIRDQVLEELAAGETDIIVGTHALIEDPVQFKSLGLVVVDEQHKFGVKQRARLWRKADPYPHNMIMTATPIPRTLAMTLYGDVDVSVIDELPPGRKPIKTFVRGEKKRLEVFGFLRKQIEEGRQVYVVYPLVEESEKLDYLAAEKGHELLERYFKPYRVGIVHGRMRPDDKEFEMQRFVKNETQILVSTTVIEVGVDVPNANVIVIENAEKFGLSQLHQLRGRVGRGAEQAYCLLMTGTKLSAEGRKRLKAMTETTSGFRISEIDLEIRGPGDFLGTRQSGLPEFQLANIAEDQEILQDAREAAFELIERDPMLKAEENRAISSFYRYYAPRIEGLSGVA